MMKIKKYDILSFKMGNLYRSAMSQKLPVDGFKWIKETPQYNVDLKKGYKDDKIIGCFFFLKFILNV